jgi:NAD(P)-dependent dehydrogenase (short-subunit alcohol dehydrogenase family)
MKTLVLGATGSLGSALCARLTVDGHSVVAVGRTQDKLDNLRTSLSAERHQMFACDVTDSTALANLFTDLRDQQLTGMVILTGAHWLKPIGLLRPADTLSMATDHLVAYFEATRLFLALPHKNEIRRSVVWVSSAAALRGNPGEAAYAAVKAAGIAAVRSLAGEANRKATRINAVAPGVVRSDQAGAFMSKLSEAQQGTLETSHILGLGDPADVAGPIAFLLSEDARWITGTCLVVDGGLTA